MHIPDGFLSPITYVPADVAAAALVWYGMRRVGFESEQIPYIAALSALGFVFMMVAIPLPGGSSAHLQGVALMALLFGPWRSFLAFTLVLTVEALIFAEGGILVLGVNILAIAFIGSFTAYAVYALLKKFAQTLAIFVATVLSVVSSSLFIATVLGIQTLLPHGDKGFFPFDLSVTVPALAIPHLIIGCVEGAVTVALYRYLYPRVTHVR